MTIKSATIMGEVEGNPLLVTKRPIDGRARFHVAVAISLCIGTAIVGGALWGSTGWLGADLTPRFEQVSAAWNSNGGRAGFGAGAVADVARDGVQAPWLHRTDTRGAPQSLGQVAVGQRMTWRGADGVEHFLEVTDVKPLGTDVVPVASASQSVRLLLVTMRPVGAGEGVLAIVPGAAAVRMIVETDDPVVTHPSGDRTNKAL
ncbi:MAG: hypothetical protein ABL898_04350 [Hyphomicrobiaceae bacterium]